MVVRLKGISRGTFTVITARSIDTAMRAATITILTLIYVCNNSTISLTTVKIKVVLPSQDVPSDNN